MPRCREIVRKVYVIGRTGFDCDDLFVLSPVYYDDTWLRKMEVNFNLRTFMFCVPFGYIGLCVAGSLSGQQP